MVGAVHKAALARHYCNLSQGPGGRAPWEAEGDGAGHQEDSHQILSPGLYPLHKEAVLPTQEEVSKHV